MGNGTSFETQTMELPKVNWGRNLDTDEKSKVSKNVRKKKVEKSMENDINIATINVKDVGFSYFFFKRSFDIASSLLLIVVISWLLLILLVIQTITTKGHPIFADKRIGKNGKKINVLKFRSMYYDAETNIDKYLTAEQKETWIRERKLDNDPRITPFGNFIRKTSLDELPQLFNILFGSMSVIGPRPITETELANFTEEQQKVLLSAKPGLTGYWQVYGRSDVDFESGKRQKLELEYFSKRGLWFDFCLIFKTIPAVLRRRGAK